MSEMPTAAPLLQVRHLGRRFALPRAGLWQPADPLQALTDVSFTLQAGKSLGVSASRAAASPRWRLVMRHATEVQVYSTVDKPHAQAAAPVIATVGWCLWTLAARWTAPKCWLSWTEPIQTCSNQRMAARTAVRGSGVAFHPGRSQTLLRLDKYTRTSFRRSASALRLHAP